MKKLFLVLLILYNCIQIFAQSQSEKINLLILTQKYSEALSKSEELINTYPDNAYFHYQNSMVNKLMYRYPQAFISIQNALNLEPENIEFLTEYAILLEKKEKEKEATEIFSLVFDRNNNHFYSGIWLGNHYLKAKKFDDALNVLNQLYSNDTLNAYVARSIGLCWYKKGDSKNSKLWFFKAIQLDSTDIKAYKYLFSTYAAKEEFDLAFQTIDRAIEIEPQDKSLYVLKGDLHVIRNHHYKAVDAYLKAYELDIKDEEVLRKLGLSYFKTEKFDKAKYFLLLSDKVAMNLEVYKHLGLVYRRENKPDSSTLYFEKALDILRTDNNTLFDIYIDIAENHLGLGNYRHTIMWYERALNLELMGIWSVSSKNGILIDLASVYSDKMNDKQKAIEYLKKVTNDNSIILLNKENYYSYAQKEISRLKEELFFEGKL
jgi:superkiller protein 3